MVSLPKLNPVLVPSNFSRSSLAARAGIRTGRLQTLSATQISTAPEITSELGDKRSEWSRRDESYPWLAKQNPILPQLSERQHSRVAKVYGATRISCWTMLLTQNCFQSPRHFQNQNDVNKSDQRGHQRARENGDQADPECGRYSYVSKNPEWSKDENEVGYRRSYRAAQRRQNDGWAKHDLLDTWVMPTASPSTHWAYSRFFHEVSPFPHTQNI